MLDVSLLSPGDEEILMLPEKGYGAYFIPRKLLRETIAPTKTASGRVTRVSF
jgi:hypothetical protein